ncbi:hypothetical protein G9A89_000149 [Geosiphon pyriformis]|nr:hypothetical protein G9A89_000149 [Geosiphon pyriformis]
MCNVCGLNNPVKQDDIICWHKNMNNLVFIFMELKLKGKVHLWLTNKFDGVWVFTSGLDFGSLGADVLIVINSSLAKHVYKISKVPGWLLSIKLLFKNKLSVSILGLYAGASSVVRFSQTGEINSLIAKAVNEAFFVVFDGDFNEDSSQKCASFKKCFELRLVNFLIKSLAIKMPTWANFKGVMKTIDYVFVSLNLVNSLVHHGVSDVSKYFNADHQAVSVSVDLDSLLDTHLFSLRKQTNKDHWKFDVKNASKTKWLEFKNAMAANTIMFSGAFGVAVKFSDLGTMWNIICKIMVLSAGGAFKKRWFKGFDIICNKVLSRFHKLELLVSKLVKASHLSFSVSFALLLVRSMFFSGAKFDDIRSALAKAKKLYCSSKLLESKHAEESHIRQVITNRMESFELNKSRTIRSVLECPFRKVVLDHLVVDNELVLEPDLVRSKGVLMNTRPIALIKTAHKILLDKISLAYSSYDVLCSDNFSVLKGTTTQSLIFAVGLVIEDALEKNWELWLVLQNMWKAYDSVGWEHFKKSLVRIKMCSKFVCFFGSIYRDQTNCVMTDFGLIDDYRVFDGLDQGEVFSSLLWRIFYDSLLCEVKHQESVYSYRLNSYFVFGSGHTESQTGFSTFLAAGAFVDDTIWVGSSQTATQHILIVASEFF